MVLKQELVQMELNVDLIMVITRMATLALEAKDDME